MHNIQTDLIHTLCILVCHVSAVSSQLESVCSGLFEHLDAQNSAVKLTS